MGISEDRWTCPECNWTYVVRESRTDARAKLSAVRESHAKEHVNGHGAPRRVIERGSASAQPDRSTSHPGEAVWTIWPRSGASA